MPWIKLDDRARGNPKLRAVGKAVRGGMLMIWGYVGEQRTDGWVPADIARQELTAAELAVATSVQANGSAPLLHRPGDQCACLTGAHWTAEMGGYWVHDWLHHNPSKAENTVHRAKRRELGDRDLVHLVKMRDGNACRYCGEVTPWADKKSARSLCIDHVNPTLAAGADNLVVACTHCNSSKKDALTPTAAGLTLLPPPVPGSVPVNGWPKGTDPTSIARAEPPDQITDQSGDRSPDPSPIRSPIDQRSDRRSIADPDPGDSPAQNGDEQREPTSPPSPDATGDGLPLGRGRDGSGPRSSPGPRAGDVGPAGRRPQVGPATTPRTATTPPTYRKTATSNPTPPGGAP